MITEGQVAGNPKEAAEMIAVLTKENEQLRAALKDVLSWYESSFDENTLDAEQETVRAAHELLQ